MESNEITGIENLSTFELLFTCPFLLFVRWLNVFDFFVFCEFREKFSTFESSNSYLNFGNLISSISLKHFYLSLDSSGCYVFFFFFHWYSNVLNVKKCQCITVTINNDFLETNTLKLYNTLAVPLAVLRTLKRTLFFSFSFLIIRYFQKISTTKLKRFVVSHVNN